MRKFDFRAECLRDTFLFLDAISVKYRIFTCTFVPDPTFPDVDVSFFAQCRLDDLLGMARSIDDAHVIVETLEMSS